MNTINSFCSAESGTRMRPLFFLLAIYFIAGCSSPQKSDEEKGRERLVRNAIESITEYKTSFIPNTAEKEQLSHLQIFNKKGFIVKEIDYGESGNAEHVLVHQYDKNDNLICTTTKNPDSSLSGREVRKYDEKNNLKESIYFLSDGTIEHKYTYVYDSEERMLEMDVYWPEELSAVHKYSYEGKKKLEDAEYSPEKKLLGKWNYKYDSHGNLLEAILSGPAGDQKSKISYVYNLINQVIRQATYSGESLQNTLSYEYDKKYLLSIRTDFSSTGKITTRHRYQYKFF